MDNNLQRQNIRYFALLTTFSWLFYKDTNVLYLVNAVFSVLMLIKLNDQSQPESNPSCLYEEIIFYGEHFDNEKIDYEFDLDETYIVNVILDEKYSYVYLVTFTEEIKGKPDAKIKLVVQEGDDKELVVFNSGLKLVVCPKMECVMNIRVSKFVY